MSGIKGGSFGQKIQCQDPCKNPCNPCQKVPICVDPCQKVPICVDPCQDPCKAGLVYYGSHHHHGHHGHHYHVRKQDPCNPCCPDPCQNQGSYYCNK